MAGQKFYRNDGKRFVDVTKTVGINGSKIGYGLGVAVSDIDLDGWPDIYVGNDFHENDYLYINQHDGTFKDKGTEQIMHTSQFSMGVDVADINNDAYPEIVSMDMLPYDPYMLAHYRKMTIIFFRIRLPMDTLINMHEIIYNSIEETIILVRSVNMQGFNQRTGVGRLCGWTLTMMV
jgi:hypothetical protein